MHFKISRLFYNRAKKFIVCKINTLLRKIPITVRLHPTMSKHLHQIVLVCTKTDHVIWFNILNVLATYIDPFISWFYVWEWRVCPDTFLIEWSKVFVLIWLLRTLSVRLYVYHTMTATPLYRLSSNVESMYLVQRRINVIAILNFPTVSK